MQPRAHDQRVDETPHHLVSRNSSDYPSGKGATGLTIHQPNPESDYQWPMQRSSQPWSQCKNVQFCSLKFRFLTCEKTCFKKNAFGKHPPMSNAASKETQTCSRCKQGEHTAISSTSEDSRRRKPLSTILVEHLEQVAFAVETNYHSNRLRKIGKNTTSGSCLASWRFLTPERKPELRYVATLSYFK